jgi:hypothetical protein
LLRRSATGCMYVVPPSGGLFTGTIWPPKGGTTYSGRLKAELHTLAA